MQTIYLILSNDYISINESINEILNENDLKEEYIIKYDLSDINIDEVINDLNTYNFLVDKKVIVASNCNFLSSNKVKETEQDIDNLIRYINNPSDENILILITDRVDERKNIVKLLREKATVIEKEIAIDTIIKNRLDGYEMSNSDIEYLIDYCGNNNEKILNELEKLKCYKLAEKKIDYNDIEEIVMKSFNDNVFALIDAIMSKKRQSAIRLYDELVENGEDINKIVALLADQFRMIYNGKILLREHDNNYREVAKILGVHPYRFQKAIDSSYKYNYTEKKILQNLNKIDDIEIAIKTGKSTIAAFEMFIYSL